MKIRSLLLISTLTFCSSSVLASAAEDRWNSMPEERQAGLIDRAAENGFDITTEEGRQEFHEFRREERTAKAAELGFDLTTKEGREAYQELRQTQQDDRQEAKEVRREQIASLSTDERTQLKEELDGLSKEERRELLNDRFGG